MIARILAIVVLLVIAIPLVTFLVINRGTVPLTLDPFGTMPQFSYELPLSLVMIVSAIVGVVAGCVFTWISQSGYRQDSWRRKFEMERLEREKQEQAEALKRLRQERIDRANAERGEDARPALASAQGSSTPMIGSEKAA